MNYTKRQYTGYEIEDGKIVDKAKFVVMGEMADGMKCYYKIVDGKEDTTRFYSRARINGHTVFFLEGAD